MNETFAAPNDREPPLGALIAYILDRYHRPLRVDLHELVCLAEVVCQEERSHPSCPHGLAAHLRDVAAALEDHMTKEERILFPMILAGGRARMPIRVMLGEHDDHVASFARTRALTGELTPPDDASLAWLELYTRLRSLETALVSHIRFENDVLFPRVLRG
jgi:regulator of cell morphogenesis and NO signaling